MGELGRPGITPPAGTRGNAAPQLRQSVATLWRKVQTESDAMTSKRNAFLRLSGNDERVRRRSRLVATKATNTACARLRVERRVWKHHPLLRMVGNPLVTPTPAQLRAAPPTLAGDLADRNVGGVVEYRSLRLTHPR
jgi:hypothetical protein